MHVCVEETPTTSAAAAAASPGPHRIHPGLFEDPPFLLRRLFFLRSPPPRGGFVRFDCTSFDWSARINCIIQICVFLFFFLTLSLSSRTLHLLPILPNPMTHTTQRNTFDTPTPSLFFAMHAFPLISIPLNLVQADILHASLISFF